MDGRRLGKTKLAQRARKREATENGPREREAVRQTVPAGAEAIACADRLRAEWSQALAGESASQSYWQSPDAAAWSWRNGGLCLGDSGCEWSSVLWKLCDPTTWRRLPSFVLAVTVQGEGDHAGFSFGHFKDFLAEVKPQARRLQLELDGGTGQWRFRVDGQLMEATWWNSAVTSADDILHETLMLKARWPREVTFTDFSLTLFAASCKISVVMTCSRFLQRLRLALRSWSHQESPGGLHEVMVVNAGNPDGTHEHLRAVARSYPELRICEIAVPSALASNKGAMINAAIPHCHGEWLWFTDADCLFPLNAVDLAWQYVHGRQRRLLYGQRRYLTQARTEELLAGKIDSLSSFDALAGEALERCPEDAPWGYTQIVHRSALSRLKYPESFDHFAHGDNHFVKACKLRRILPERVPGLFCLHLDHPFAWYGSSEFL
jgi:hypothetical protein